VANLVKKLLIKLMATHFHKEAHFQRMQEALRKVRVRSVVSVCVCVCVCVCLGW
jgi:hypothetical protein